MNWVPSARLLIVASLVVACGDDDGGDASTTDSTTGSTMTGSGVTLTTIPVTSETLDTTISASDGTTDDDSTGDTSPESSEDTHADDTTSGPDCDCEGDDLGGQDCTTIDGGFLGGELACSDSCAFDTSACIPGPALDVEFCRLQHPLDISEPAGTVEVVYGRVYVEGVTDQTTGTDPHPALTGWVGYGPENSDPSIDDTDWVWIEASPNPGYDDQAAFGEENNDEYWLDLTVPAPGVYAFAFRFSGDLGQTFVHCDGDDEGNTNGYDPAQAGRMTSTR
jgi:hypothetical protein